MTKRLLIVFLALGLTLYNSGCTSGGSKDDSEVASANDDSFAEEGEGDFADETTDSEGDADKTADAESEADSGSEASESSDKVADESAPSEEDELSLDDEAGGEIADAEKPAAGESKQVAKGGGEDELSLEDDGLPADISGDKPAATGSTGASSELADGGVPPGEEPQFTGEAAPPPTEEPTNVTDNTAPPADAPSTDIAASEPAAPPAAAPAAFIPVQKIKSEPFNKNGTTLNRVYVARPGDTAKSVSQKIYGQNRAKDLLKWNPHLNRGMKTGDKVYYSSPINPNDPQMLTYYEDIGAQPSVYTSKPGDNIRKVSKQLLGSSESWKEVWATNATVEGKGDIPGGLEIRYWPEGADAGAAAALAGAPKAHEMPKAHETLPPAGAQAPPPPTQAANGAPPDLGEDPFAENPAPPPPAPPGQDPLAASAPPPPPPDAAMAGTTAPPPPVDTAMAPPPPEPPPPAAVPETKPVKRATAPASEEEVSPATDTDTLIAMAGGGVLLIAAVLLFVVIRKNRTKRMVDLSQTQV